MANAKREIFDENLPKNIYRGTPIKERKTFCFTAESGTNMTEEPNKNQTPSPEKLLVDDSTNFPFHAAYGVYSELFDTVNGNEAKTELNRNIEALRQNTIDCETFYRNIAHHRNLAPAPQQSRFSIETQRKRDWRMKSQREERIRRHRK
jgi:hypothetical protein